MLTNPQVFPLPTMPFRRDLTTGCPVGTSIKLTGKPYEDVSKSVVLSLFTNNNDTALRVDLVLGQPAKIKIDCIVSQKTSSAVENYVMCPMNTTAQLQIKTLQHSFEIIFNNQKIADFVHRVDPNLIKSILISGPLITEQVIIEPAVAAPLPSYEQATSPPVELMSSMSIRDQKSAARQSVNDLPPPPPSVLNPTAPPVQIPVGAGASAPPMPPSTGTSTTSSSFYFTGGSQGFSNHPYPLPGLIDNSTHASQQHPVGTLPQPVPASVATAPLTSQQASSTVPPQMMPPPAPISSGAYVSAPVNHPPPTSTSSSNIYTHTPVSTPTVPYTVTFPQTASNTPAMGPQPIPPQVQNPIYQNQMGYNPYAGQYGAPQQAHLQQQQPVVMPTVAPTTVIPTTAVQPYMAPVMAPQPQPYMYPTSMQPYPMYQQYPYAYPEVVYYDGGHHHHRHHFFGHHHHHCD